MKSVFASMLALAFLVGAPGAAFAMSSPSDGSNTIVTSEVRTCMAAAVATREAALQGAWGTYNTAVMAAYTARAAALATAWTGDKTRAQIKSEVKAAWKTFKDAIKMAQKARKASNKATWSTFKTSAKACKAPSDTLDKGSEA